MRYSTRSGSVLKEPLAQVVPRAQDKVAYWQAFARACQTYLQNLSDAGTIEYLGWAYGPEHVKAYVFLNVASREELYAAMRCYPATAVEEGYQWQFHTLLSSEYCFKSMLEEAKARANG